MSWAKHAIEALEKTGRVQIRPRGNSMIPLVHSGDLVTLEKCEPRQVVLGSVVLVRVKGNIYLHKVQAINGDRFQIANNKGHVNGWVKFQAIYGLAVKIEP